MSDFPSAVGTFLIGALGAKFGVRKTHDLAYVKDTVIPGGYDSEVKTQYI